MKSDTCQVMTPKFDERNQVLPIPPTKKETKFEPIFILLPAIVRVQLNQLSLLQSTVNCLGIL